MSQHGDCDDASDYCKKGYFKYCLQDYHGALIDYTRAIELKPCCGSAYNNRALIHQLLDQHIEAVADFKRAKDFGFPVDLKDLNPQN
ncbi:MAG TPA: hypothetical protein VK470_06995 [Bacteroidota bacterium]|nr:hypothetical protein [Bacteroidota bacterium]